MYTFMYTPVGWLDSGCHRRHRQRAVGVLSVVVLTLTLLGSVPAADAEPGDTHTYSGRITAGRTTAQQGEAALSGMKVTVFCVGCDGGSNSDPSTNPARPWPLDAKQLGETTTDSSGNYSVTFTEPSSGDPWLAVWDPDRNYGYSLRSVWRGWADKTDLDSQLYIGASLSGRITLDGAAPPAADYSIRISSRTPIGIVVAADGSYSTPGLGGGAYLLDYPESLPAPYLAGYAVSLGSINSPWNEDGVEDVIADHDFLKFVSFSGRVTDGAGGGLGGINVALSAPLTRTGPGAPAPDFSATEIEQSPIVVSSIGGTGGTFSAVTASDGRYSFNTFPGSPRIVRFTSPGGEYATEYYDDKPGAPEADRVIVSRSGDVSGIDAQLAVGSSVSGYVKGPMGLPVRDASVNLCPDGATISFFFSGCQYERVTDSGRFEFVGLAAGTYRLQAGHSRLDEEVERSVELAEGEHQQFEITLDGGRISGTVTDSRGSPIAGVPVSWGWGSVSTASDGSYTTELLRARDRGAERTAEYTVKFGSSWRDPIDSQEGVEVFNGEVTTGIDAKLDVGFITGTVTSGGRPLRDADVRVGGFSAKTAADGTYRIAVEEADWDWRVEFSSPWHVQERLDVTVAAGTVVDGIDADLEEIPAPTPPPSGTDVVGGSTATGGIPSFVGDDTITIRHTGCSNGTAELSFSDPSPQDWAREEMTETPPGSGTYVASVPVSRLGSFGGRVDARISNYACDEGEYSRPSVAFSIYIDPAGTVVDQHGSRVQGAIVTLLRDDPGTLVADFEAVAAGSLLMDPYVNTSNPDVTGDDGAFRWDVVEGLWKVRATAAGCHAPGNAALGFVETAELEVPPPRLGLLLELECPGRSAPDTSEPGATEPGTSDPGMSGLDASDFFDDISDGVYYESAVAWMIRNQITTGCSSDPALFCPGSELTRAQFVTFLWRASGRPTVSQAGSAVFGDVPAGHWADQAVGWAEQKGVTTGCAAATGATKARFCLNAPVTRAQIATFLHRFVGSPTAGGAPGFTDVGPGTWYSEPVAWTAQHGFVDGCGNTMFCPAKAADRATAAAFIHAVAKNPQSWATPRSDFKFN